MHEEAIRALNVAVALTQHGSVKSLAALAGMPMRLGDTTRRRVDCFKT